MIRWIPVAIAASALAVGAVLVGRAGSKGRGSDATGTPRSSPPTVRPPSSRPAVTRGLALGDSLTAHGGYVGVLRQRTGAPWDIAAQVGASSGRVLELARQALGGSSARSYSHVVVLAGVNDGRSTRTTANLEAIYRLAREKGALVVAVAETPWGSYAGGVTPEAWARHQTARSWVLGGAGGLADVVVDSYQALEDPSRPGELRPELAARDRLHMNADGQRALGELIARGL